MEADSQPAFILKALTIGMWGMDSHLRPFTETAKTYQIAEKTAEVDFIRELALGEIIGLSYKGQKSRFRVVQSFISGPTTYRVTLVNIGPYCLWKDELSSPDVIPQKSERRKDSRMPASGMANIINEQGMSTTARLSDISRSGFYIETYAPSPVGRELLIRLTMEQKDIDTKAVVRTSHPNIGMGMEIRNFSTPEDQLRFAEIVTALEQAS
ncbi:MAG TPA: PilZ domain-containing protein [Terriglobales bacterium]|nr:PilZ domain-containing protein [Terriglobales bacterium]